MPGACQTRTQWPATEQPTPATGEASDVVTSHAPCALQSRTHLGNVLSPWDKSSEPFRDITAFRERRHVQNAIAKLAPQRDCLKSLLDGEELQEPREDLKRVLLSLTELGADPLLIEFRPELLPLLWWRCSRSYPRNGHDFLVESVMSTF